MNNRETGAAYEKVAADFLTRMGYVILERNYRARPGEIDIIAKDGQCLCFVEVKYRKNAFNGMPSEAVGYSKQRRIIAASECYMALKGLGYMERRYDVVEILGDRIRVIKNCFGGI